MGRRGTMRGVGAGTAATVTRESAPSRGTGTLGDILKGKLGGKLSVEFDRFGDQEFRNIWLAGPATFVFSGEITSNQTAGTP